MADFERWSRENLVKFAQEAQERMEDQRRLITELRAIAAELRAIAGELKEKQ